MHRLMQGLVLWAALTWIAGPLQAEDNDKADPTGLLLLSATSQLDGQLRIAQPVNVHESANAQPHTCNVDDVYVFPIQYPISPPFPKSAVASSDGPAVAAKDIVRAGGQLVYLTSKPQTGGRLGVGYLLVLVKALEPGKAKVNVKVTLADGKVKEVPFLLVVEAKEK